MQQIKLGRNGPMVSAFGLGCMGMSGIYGPATTPNPSPPSMRRSRPASPCIDTGDFYGMGHNEMLIRDALKGGKRDRAFIMVKCGSLRSPDGKIVGDDARPQSIKNFLSYSLRRLGTDHIDLYQPSRVDPQVPIEDTHRRHRRHGESRLCAPYRRLRSFRQDNATRRRGASDRGVADRIFAVHTRHRARDFADFARARHRAGRLWRAFQRTDQRPRAGGAGPRRANCGRGGRGFSPRILPRTSRWSKR